MATLDIGTTIAERIADREDIDPVELAVPLYEVIDPDALESLVSRSGGREEHADLSVEFSYLGYPVTVDGGGSVTVNDGSADT